MVKYIKKMKLKIRIKFYSPVEKFFLKIKKYIIKF